MAVIETWYNQDLQKPVKVNYLNGNLFSHNGNGNRIGVHVFDNGEPVTLAGTVSGYVVTSDGSTVPCTGSRSGNNASILVPPAAYQPGAVFITVFLTDGSTVTTLASVSTSVLVARTENQVSPGSVVTDWTQTINAAMQDVETAAENLGNIVATPYASLTFPVPLGKYTYYNDNLYRCISPIASSESFTPAHWSSAINMGDEVSSLKSALNTIFDNTELNTYLGTTANILKWNDTYGYVSSGANQITIQPAKQYPFDIKVDLSGMENFRTCRIRVFNSVFYTPANFVSKSDPVGNMITLPKNTWWTFEIFENNGVTVSVSDLSDVLFYASEVTDDTLKRSNMPADAKKTGEEFAQRDTAIAAEFATRDAVIGTANLKTRAQNLKGATNEIWDTFDYLADDFDINNYLQNQFLLWRWNDNTGYGANQTAMSIATTQLFPFDVTIKNLHYPDFYSAAVRTFSVGVPTPQYLLNTITYDFYGDGAVSEITLPKNTYWTIQFTRPGNVNIDLATYKVIPQFVVGDNIKMANQLQLNNTFVVGKKMAPYTKIQDAVDAANSGDTILILPGTYEEDVSAWGKELHFIGLDRDSTVIIERTGLYSKPTLEINIGSVRNLTLIETGEGSVWGDDDGKGRAYTVHIESGEGYTGVGELWFDNCKLINYAHAAVGCGLYQDLHVHFNNCYMYSGRAADVLDDYYRGTFYYHTCVAENITGQQMTVKDCEIINEGTACFFGGVTPNAISATCRSTFINNNFFAISAQTQNTNDIAIVYSILNFHDCKLNGNSRGNNIPVLNAP